MQTNKLKSGRSGTNPIIHEKLISLPAATDATVSFLPPCSLVQGQWVKKLANKIRKFNYSLPSPSKKLAVTLPFADLQKALSLMSFPSAPSHLSPYFGSGRWTQTLSFGALGGLDTKIKRGSWKRECHYPLISFGLPEQLWLGLIPKERRPKA